MPLISLWQSNAEAVFQFTIEQIVSTAGDGKLKDKSLCSQELRDFLSQISSDKIAQYIDQCLSNPFTNSGMVLQDLVNEMGRRLDFQAKNGRYRGVRNKVGFDGVWDSPEGHTIVVEVKTTDAYRISLNTIASYRKKLLHADEISSDSSILIVVGREDTGELEAQVRGSRHAWDIRLISTESLIKLVTLKESTDEIETAKKIRDLLIPMEYTKLDRMIDIMFTTAKDVESATEAEVSEGEEDVRTVPETKDETKGFTDSSVLQAKREMIVASLAQREHTNFIKKTRALYWNATHDVRVVCTISKRYVKKGAAPYWYAYHPKWDRFLSEGVTAFVVLGGMDLSKAFAIPLHILQKHLDQINTTVRKESQELYWHLKILETAPNEYALYLPKNSESLSLNDYVFDIIS